MSERFVPFLRFVRDLESGEKIAITKGGAALAVGQGKVWVGQRGGLVR